MSKSRKTVVLFSGHYWGSKRRAGFHHLAQAYEKLGYDVLFFTAGFSWLSFLAGDYRWKTSARKESGRIFRKRNVSSFVFKTFFHPANLRSRILNKLAAPLFRVYGTMGFGEATPWIKKASLIIFESHPSLVMAQKVMKENPTARIVYRVSDDIRFLKNHFTVIEAESWLAKRCDRISVPVESFSRFFQSEKDKVTVDHHCVDTSIYDSQMKTPYPGNGKNAVFIGAAPNNLDVEAILRVSRDFPTLNIWIIGPYEKLFESTRENLNLIGELDFFETLPFLKNADIGLATLRPRAGMEDLVSSMKIRQYTYFSLPIVGPNFMKPNLDNWCLYDSKDPKSIQLAVQQALDRKKDPSWKETVRDWKTLAADFAIAGGTPSVQGQ